MPRNARITQFGYPHLVIAKAIDGVSLFYDDDDFLNYLERLRQLTRDKTIEVSGFCLMPGEVRLLIKPIRFGLARIIQRIHGAHTQAINIKLGRCGNLFKGRFRSVLFSDGDLLQAVRAVHLWPVRSGEVKRPEHHPWSSHSLFIGDRNPHQDLIDVSRVLSPLASSDQVARAAFDRYVESAALEPDSIGLCESLPGLAGDEAFIAAVTRAKGAGDLVYKMSLYGLSKRVALLLNIDPNLLSGPSRQQDFVTARRLFATAAILQHKRSVTEVAHFLKRDKAQVSRLVSQGIDQIDDDDEPFQTLFENIRGKVTKAFFAEYL